MRFTISAVAAVVLQATSGSACTTSNEANTDCEPITDDNLLMNMPGFALYEYYFPDAARASAAKEKYGLLGNW
jgi:hypothetical protein